MSTKHQIIITGGGDSDYFKKIDRQFKKLLPAKSNIFLVPLASSRKNHAYCLHRIKETFSQLNFNHIKVCSNLKSLDYGLLTLFHAVYIDGGNTYKLTKLARESNFQKQLKKFLDEGGVVNGDSAGGILLGKYVDTAKIGDIADRNTVRLTDFSGLNLLKGWSVHCHFHPETEMGEVSDYVKERGKTLALTDKTAIYLNGKEGKVIGRGDLYIFKKKHVEIVRPGERFSL